ncbi:uncharacterized protein DS421_10g293760 [Arachis hypogaea]|nr:uncharacterized protein DS421_10g293760 [Arachis hypogaea]
MASITSSIFTTHPTIMSSTTISITRRHHLHHHSHCHHPRHHHHHHPFRLFLHVELYLDHHPSLLVGHDS